MRVFSFFFVPFLTNLFFWGVFNGSLSHVHVNASLTLNGCSALQWKCSPLLCYWPIFGREERRGAPDCHCLTEKQDGWGKHSFLYTEKSM